MINVKVFDSNFCTENFEAFNKFKKKNKVINFRKYYQNGATCYLATY